MPNFRKNKSGVYGMQQYAPQMPANYNQSPQKKRSGAKMVMTKTGVRCITGWNYSRTHGMISLVAVQKRGGKASNGNIHVNECMTKTGQVREVWACTIQKKFQKDVTFTGFFDPMSNKLRIPDLNMVASVNANYFGRSISKR